MSGHQAVCLWFGNPLQSVARNLIYFFLCLITFIFCRKCALQSWSVLLKGRWEWGFTDYREKYPIKNPVRARLGIFTFESGLRLNFTKQQGNITSLNDWTSLRKTSRDHIFTACVWVALGNLRTRCAKKGEKNVWTGKRAIRLRTASTLLHGQDV